MTISSISGSDGGTSLADLQRQLVADEKALAAAVKAKASAQELAVDQSKVTLDEAAISAAGAQTVIKAATQSASSPISTGVSVYL